MGPKLWPLECSQGFSMIWPTDLVFDPNMSHIRNLTEIFIKAKHSDKIFHEHWMHNVGLYCVSQGFSII